jgi:hypothetical protein
MFNKRLLSSTVIATLTVTAPAFAQSQIDNNQPVQGSLHSREVKIQNELNTSYAAGLISSTELAEMQRDLDGILVKEDRQRTKADGSVNSNFDKIAKSLDCFEGKILGYNSKKVASSAVVVPINEQIVPITGNQSSVFQPAQPTFMVPATTVGVPVTTSTTTIDVPSTTTTRTTTIRSSVAAPSSTIIVPTP